MILAIDWSRWTDWAAVPGKIVLLLLIAVALRLVIRRVVDRLVARTSESATPKRPLGSSRVGELVGVNSTLYRQRRHQRAQALGSLFKSIATLVISTVVIFMALGLLGYNLAPLIASAGIVGVALGFGAQNLVKDFISGVFMLLEDQYGVGDVVDLGEATGTVEGVSLRTTRLRGFDGVTWYVRNGEVLRVGNRSQGWSALSIDVTVGYGTDVRRVQDLLTETAQAMAAEPDWQAKIVEVPSVLGVQEMNGYGLTLRVWGKCVANQQWSTERELRRRVKDVFDSEGVAMPVPPLAGVAGMGGSTGAGSSGNQPGPS